MVQQIGVRGRRPRSWTLGGRLAPQVVVALIGVALVAAVLASFARTAVITEVPDYGGAYVEGLAGFPQTLNPIFANDDASRTVCALLFSGLTKMDANGQPMPDLAQAWTISDDGKTYTFTLRSNARWHDGQPVTADDVVFTYKTIQDPQFPGPLAALWRDVQVEKVDDRTVKLTLPKDSFAPFLEYTAVGLLPSHLLNGLSVPDMLANRFNVEPVGTGPFRIKDVQPDQLSVEVSPNYYGPKPYLSRIVFRVYPNYKTILTAVERDEVEGVPMVDPGDIARVSRDKGLTLYQAPQASLTMLFFNVAAAPLNDKAVRQAIAYTVDRQKLIDVARQGYAKPANGPILPFSWAYSQEAKPPALDPAKAKEVLDQAGWKLEGDDATVRTKSGKRLHLVLLTNDRPERVKAAEEIQQELAAVGFEVEVQATGAGGLVQDFLKPRSYQMALYSWDFDGFDPDPYALWHSSQTKGSGLNITGWSDRKADELLEKGRRTTDKTERAKLYGEFQALFAEEVPSVPLFYPMYTFAVSDKVKGIQPEAIASPADHFRNVLEWHVKFRREVTGRH